MCTRNDTKSQNRNQACDNGCEVRGLTLDKKHFPASRSMTPPTRSDQGGRRRPPQSRSQLERPWHCCSDLEQRPAALSSLNWSCSGSRNKESLSWCTSCCSWHASAPDPVAGQGNRRSA